MRFGQFIVVPAVMLALAVPAAAAATHTRRGPTAPSKAFSKRAAKPKVQGQRTIDDERATQIQAALIKAGYLSGTPSGHWDPETQAAMEKVQADNGWQTKLVPDSRALIKLGLGPSTASPDSLVSQPAPIAANQPRPLAQP
jgi:peptidoglycan hydrolase-like protein with peptidoglycan-binding domain